MHISKYCNTDIRTNQECGVTVPIDKILSIKDARAWVSMVSYLKE